MERLEKLLGTGGLTPDIHNTLDHALRGAERLRSLLRDVQLYLAVAQSAPPARHDTASDA